MTTVFDNYKVMKDKEGVAGVYETLDKLDEMLTTYGVKHCFTLPHEADIAKNRYSTVTLCFNSEDDMIVSLVYALFSKFYRKADDKLLGEGLAKVASRYIGNEVAI